MPYNNYHGMMGKNSKSIAFIFFFVGIIGAIGLRIVFILGHVSSFLGKLSWYVAMIAFIFFYYYRFIIESKRRKMIIRNKLRSKIENRQLDEKDYECMKRVIDSMLVSKLNKNFALLFSLTLLALIVQIILDVYF